MRTIAYEQIWNQEAWIQDMHLTARAIFAEQEDIQWLVGNGHRPTFLEYEIPELAQRCYQLTFQVPDTVVTHLILLFPQHEHRMEF